MLPVLICVLLLLKCYAGAIDWLSWANRDVCTMSLLNPRLSDAIGVVGIVLLLVALSVRSYHMPSRGHSTLTQQEFLRFDLVPTVLAALFLSGRWRRLVCTTRWQTMRSASLQWVPTRCSGTGWSAGWRSIW